MPLYLDSFKNRPPLKLSKDFYVKGLDVFTRQMEKVFFSNVTVCKYASEKYQIKLVIELACDLSLLELLHHFNKDLWGDFNQDESALFRLLEDLRCDNEGLIEIEEFSIFLKDTSIVVNRIYQDSIPKQLKNILTELGNHYVYYTKGLNEIPFEIYIPVFEDNILEIDKAFANSNVGEYGPKDYYRYWGIYYNSKEDAVIYDLENISLIDGDLYMLNH